MNSPRLLFLPLFLSLSLDLYAETYGPISVQEIQLAENRADATSHGYVEYRFRVTNRDSKQHHVALRLSKARGFGYAGPSLVQTTNAVTVPPNTSVIVPLLQPVVKMVDNAGVSVTIDGRLQREPTQFSPAFAHLSLRHKSSDTVNAFVSQKVPVTDIRDKISRQTGSEDINCWSANAPVSEWSENWLAYTRFDGVLLTSDEWRNLQDQSPGILKALRKYTEAGGCLCIVGYDWTPPKEWTPIDNAKGKYSAGFGEVRVVPDSPHEAAPYIDPLRELLFEQAKPWGSAISSSHEATGSMSGIETMLVALPVIKSYGTPVKMIMVLIVVFAVFIGPVNIYVLELMKRRIWLLWTVPVTSLVFSAFVLGINVVQEGFLWQSSSKTTTILDQRTGEATTVGHIGFYSTLTPRGGIMFDADTEVTACFERDTYGPTRSLEFDIVGGGRQQFSRGWIGARTPSYFAIRKAQSQRKERIEFNWNTSPPTASNGLGVDIKVLQVCSPDGKTYEINNLEAGQQMPLTAKLFESKKEPEKELRNFFLRTIRDGPTPGLSAKMLTNGTYLAQIDTWNPFVECGIEGMKSYKNSTTVYGAF